MKSLKPVEIHGSFPKSPEKSIFKHFSITVSTIQLQALSLGSKFCSTSANINEFHAKIQFESFICQINDLIPVSNKDYEHFKQLIDCCNQYVNEIFTTRR